MTKHPRALAGLNRTASERHPMTSQDRELLPCPFDGCDGRAAIDYDAGYYAACRKCKARGPRVENTVAEAIAAWNRRSPVVTDVEREKLAAMIEEHAEGVRPIIQ